MVAAAQIVPKWAKTGVVIRQEIEERLLPRKVLVEWYRSSLLTETTLLDEDIPDFQDAVVYAELAPEFCSPSTRPAAIMPPGNCTFCPMALPLPASVFLTRRHQLAPPQEGMGQRPLPPISSCLT
ncbi:MAG: hypothetical protein M5U34_49350 [Chloroflexi bacterium]|nr:hypothetical protein [Chloroflexota bacterium]